MKTAAHPHHQEKVCISSDALIPDMFRAMRSGGDRAAVDTSVEALQAAARHCSRRVSVGVEFVATRHNIDALPSFCIGPSDTPSIS